MLLPSGSTPGENAKPVPSNSDSLWRTSKPAMRLNCSRAVRSTGTVRRNPIVLEVDWMSSALSGFSTTSARDRSANTSSVASRALIGMPYDADNLR